jgi:hypothetical protein
MFTHIHITKWVVVKDTSIPFVVDEAALGCLYGSFVIAIVEYMKLP